MKNDVPSKADDASALERFHAELAARVAKLLDSSKAQRAATTAADANAEAALATTAHDMMVKAGEGIAQQTRTFHLLMGCNPSAADIAGCVRDLIKAVDTYDSWVSALLQAVLPVVRKSIGQPCAMVLKALAGVVQKAATTGKSVASDTGKVQEAVDAIRKLEIASSVVAARLLRESARLARDALRELKEVVADVKKSAAAGKEGGERRANGDGADDEDDEDEGDEEEDDEAGLLAVSAIASPLETIVDAGAQTIEISADVVCAAPAASWTPQRDPVLNMLITCAQATSTCIDSAVASAYEVEPKALAGHAGSLCKVLKRMYGVLRERCGVEGHAASERLATLELAVECELAALQAACAAEEASEQVAALAIN